MPCTSSPCLGLPTAAVWNDLSYKCWPVNDLFWRPITVPTGPGVNTPVEDVFKYGIEMSLKLLKKVG